MKTNSIFSRWALSLLLGVLAVNLPAADPEARPPAAPERRGNRPLAQNPDRQQARPAGAIERLLTDEQRDQMMMAIRPYREEFRQLESKAIQTRRELEAAIIAEKLDEDAIRRKARALADIEGERAILRARAFAKVRPTLSDEQLERLKNRDFPGPERMNERGPRPPGVPEDVLPPPEGAPRPPPREGDRAPRPPEPR